MHDKELPVPPQGYDDLEYDDGGGGEEYFPEYVGAQSTGYGGTQMSRRLSTITELTEDTQSRATWPTRQELQAAHAPRRPPSTPSSSSFGRSIPPPLPPIPDFPPNALGLMAQHSESQSGFSISSYGQQIGVLYFLIANTWP